MVATMHRLFVTEEPQVVTLDHRLVIDALRKEADVTRSALTHRQVDLKGLFLKRVADCGQEASNSRSITNVMPIDHLCHK